MFNKVLNFAVLLVCSNVAIAQNGTVTIDQDKQIDRLLTYKKDISTNDIYKIQVFSGSRSEAEKVKLESSNLFSDWPISIEYNTPNYKIWVGNFTNKLEAERALQKIKPNYQTAFIFKPKLSSQSY